MVLLNKQLLPASEARLSPFDLGLTVGDGIFETLRTHHGHPFAFPLHFQRFKNSAELLGLIPPDPETLLADIHRLLSALQPGDARLRITLTAGEPGPNLSRLPENQNLFLTATPLLPPKPDATVILSKTRRDPAAISSRAKTLSYGENLWAYRQTLAQNADEALLLNYEDEIAEATMSNFFAWHGNTLLTPPLSSGCLPGITRTLALELAAELKIPIREAPLHRTFLSSIEEAFLTSTTRGIQPISHLQNRLLPIQKTIRLQAAYQDLLNRDSRSDPPPIRTNRPR